MADMTRGSGRSIFKTICPNCKKYSTTSYYGFCCSFCLCEFASENGFIHSDLTSGIYANQDSEDSAKIQSLEDTIKHFRDDLDDLTDIKSQKETLERSHRRMEEVVQIMKEEAKEAERKIEKILKKNTELIAENKVLHNKYTRFEIMELG